MHLHIEIYIYMHTLALHLVMMHIFALCLQYFENLEGWGQAPSNFDAAQSDLDLLWQFVSASF